MRSNALLALSLALMAGAWIPSKAAEKTSRELCIEVDDAVSADPKTYPRELIEKAKATAIAELKQCQPNAAIVSKLAELPDNTWLEMNEPESKGTPLNHHSFPKGRGEGSGVYDANVKGMVCFGGCTIPDYSCDLWVYKTGANKWFEVWPNVTRGHWKKLEAFPTDRPLPSCTIGLAYAATTGKTYRFIAANAGTDSPNVWETEVLSGTWKIVGKDNISSGGIRIAEDPELKGLLAVPPGMGTRLFTFESGKWTTLTTDGPKTAPCHALTYIPKHKCLLLVTGRPGDERTSFNDGNPREVQTWLFHSESKTWEQIKGSPSPEWFYRGGIAYDSRNDIVAFGGWKEGPPGDGPGVTPGLWIFDPNAKKWSFSKPASGPKGRYEYFCYDPEYNVFVTAGNGHGTWVYRYKRAPASGGAKP